MGSFKCQCPEELTLDASGRYCQGGCSTSCSKIFRSSPTYAVRFIIVVSYNNKRQQVIYINLFSKERITNNDDFVLKIYSQA